MQKKRERQKSIRKLSIRRDCGRFNYNKSTEVVEMHFGQMARHQSDEDLFYNFKQRTEALGKVLLLQGEELVASVS